MIHLLDLLEENSKLDEYAKIEVIIYNQFMDRKVPMTMTAKPLNGGEKFFS